jgi:hypothetical protein
MRSVKRWTPTLVAGKPAANERLPQSRSRGELDIRIVDGYRKVVLAMACRTRRRGTFFSSSG